MRNGGWRICFVSPSRGGGRAGAGAASSQAPHEEGRVWWQGEEANVDRGSRLKEVVMSDAVIIDAVRTPLGKGRPGGALAGVHPVDLLAQPLVALVERTGIDPRVIDDVIAGCVSQIGEQSTNIARRAVLAAGYPERVPATTVDRQCGSAQQAIHFAAQGVLAGAYDVVVAGGVESMSRVPMGSNVAGADLDGPRPAARC